MNLKALLGENPLKRLALYPLVAFLGYLFLRGCLPSRGELPQGVYNEIQERYVECIGMEETAFWPGEPRTPECGQVDVYVIGEGTVPEQEQAASVVRAVCFRVEIQNPYWTTAGPGVVRHEIRLKKRVTSKVTLLKNGVWETYPDQYQEDRTRWEMYACPATYELTEE